VHGDAARASCGCDGRGLGWDGDGDGDGEGEGAGGARVRRVSIDRGAMPAPAALCARKNVRYRAPTLLLPALAFRPFRNTLHCNVPRRLHIRCGFLPLYSSIYRSSSPMRFCGESRASFYRS
jgi:hypothetical protein